MIGPSAPIFERGCVTSCSKNRILLKQPGLTNQRSYASSARLHLTRTKPNDWMSDGVAEGLFSNSV